MYDHFNNKHVRWIDDVLKLPELQLSLLAPKLSEKNSRGRPKKSFEESY